MPLVFAVVANAEVTQAPSRRRSARAPRCGQPSPLGGGSEWLPPSSWFPINYSLGRQSGCRHLGWRLQSHSLWLLLCTTLARHFMRNNTQFDISYWPHVLLSNTKMNLWRSQFCSECLYKHRLQTALNTLFAISIFTFLVSMMLMWWCHGFGCEYKSVAHKRLSIRKREDVKWFVSGRMNWGFYKGQSKICKDYFELWIRWRYSSGVKDNKQGAGNSIIGRASSATDDSIWLTNLMSQQQLNELSMKLWNSFMAPNIESMWFHWWLCF